MDPDKFRSWVAARQGLEGRTYSTASEALSGAGWQRSVGGVTPYIAIRARSGDGREQIDARAAGLELFELPAARGCTYVVPADHFALGLSAGRSFGPDADLATAKKLGVAEDEIARLEEGVLAALTAGPRSPADLKTDLGSLVRNLGDEGKRKGLTTTLPVALGRLQADGRIRRKPMNGRFDTQRYEYELWSPPLGELPEETDMQPEVARLYFSWIGAATLKEFREFSAFSAKAAKAACESIGLVPFGGEPDLLSTPGAWVEYQAHEPPCEPIYRLVGSMDSHLLLRRGSQFWLDSADAEQTAPTEKGLLRIGALAELSSHAILDRGRLVGLWEFDPDEGVIEWISWQRPDNALLAAITDMEKFVREELGDARSFSLDSPASRRSALDTLKSLRMTAFG